MIFSEVLKKLRQDADITQIELAKATGLGKSTIAMYESGKREPNFEILKLLASFFNVSPGSFLDNKNTEYTNSQNSIFFSEVLKKLRQNADITQVELSEATGLSQSTIAMYENGKREPNFETLKLLASFFNVSPGSFLDNKNTETVKPQSINENIKDKTGTEMTIRNEFVKKFNELLSNSNHTQAELARYMDVSTPTVTDWKTGKIMPRIDKIERIASFFQVAPEYLLSPSNNEKTEKYTWLHGLIEDVLQDDPHTLAVLEAPAPYVAGEVSTTAKDVLRSSLRLVADSAPQYSASADVLLRGGGNEYTKNNST